MKRLLTLFLLLLCSQVYAQDYLCYGPLYRDSISPAVPPCKPVSAAFEFRYKVKENYIPINDVVQPPFVHKTVKINIIVVNPLVEPLPADPSYEPMGQPVNYHSGDVALINAFIAKANDYLTSNPSPSDPKVIGGRTPYITDTRFRLQVDNISFITSDELHWAGDFGPAVPPSLLIDPENTLNVILTYTKKGTVTGGIANNSPKIPSLSATFTPNYDNDLHEGIANGTPVITIKNFWKDPNFRSGSGSAERCANLLLHELGHTLGLNHTYHKDYGTPRGALEIGYDLTQESFEDYLQDVFGISSGSPGSKIHPRPANNATCGTATAAAAHSNDSCTNNCMGGNPEGNYRSPQQLGRMHRNAYFLNCRNFIYNTYPADDTHPDPYHGQGQQYPVDITGNETWDFDIKMYNDIHIKNNGTLTITCTVRMPHYSNIVIEPGGKLIVDGGTITSDRLNTTWRGIMVQGNSSLNQDGGGQGILELKNGATLENARDAIVVGDDRSMDYSKGGGIIRISDAIFHNNMRSVCFWTYKNFATWPSYREVDNRSYIRTSQFLVDDDIIYKPNCQISLWEVSGISILGCTIKNTMSPERRDVLGGSGDGIVSDGSKYNVSEYCSPLHAPCSTGTATPSEITGWFRGIFAYNSVLTRNFSASNTKFEKNGYGIYLAAVNTVSAEKNTFKIQDFSGEVHNPVGFRSLASDFYKVRFNKFAPVSYESGFSPAFPDRPYYIFPGNTLGTLIEESGGDWNSIVANEYDFLGFGNYSRGCNTNGTKLGDADNTGLEFLCNDYGINHYDQYMAGYSAASDGMRCVQGAAENPSGNKFTVSTTPETIAIESYMHYITPFDGDLGIYYTAPIHSYYYSTPNAATEMPTRYTSPQITLVGRPDPAVCPTPGGGPDVGPIIGGLGSTTPFVSLASALEDTSADRTTLLHGVYDSLNSPYADVDRVLLYYQNGNIQSGTVLYDAILTNYPDLLPKEVNEFTIGKSLMKLYAAHYQNNLSMDTLSPAEIDTLEYVRDNGNMWAKARACNWLFRVTKVECPMPDIYIPEDTSQTMRLAPKPAEWCVISPNPSEGNFNVSYNLEHQGDALLTVTDITGRKLFSTVLPSNARNSVIPAQNWPVSVYIYTISQGGKTIYHGKLLKK